MLRELVRAKTVIKGPRFKWCPPTVKKCVKKYAEGSPTHYVFIGYRGSVKICTCCGTEQSVRKYV